MWVATEATNKPVPRRGAKAEDNAPVDRIMSVAPGERRVLRTRCKIAR